MSVMIETKLEDTLNGGYLGLYGEVVTCDCYKMKSVPFTPDFVVDIGANVGVFTRYARSLWPQARIIAVEPDWNNRRRLKHFTDLSNVLILPFALGQGNVYHQPGAVNGSGEVYLSAGLGYPQKELDKLLGEGKLEKAGLDSLSLDTIISSYVPIKAKTVLKVDCEGGENSIWEDAESMEALRTIDYIALELHMYALHGGLVSKVKEVTMRALNTLQTTHDCTLEGVYFWATKKKGL